MPNLLILAMVLVGILSDDLYLAGRWPTDRSGLVSGVAYGVASVGCWTQHDRFGSGLFGVLAAVNLWLWWNDDNNRRRRRRLRKLAAEQLAKLRSFAPSPIPSPA